MKFESTKIRSFFSKYKKKLIFGVAIVLVGGGCFYLYQTQQAKQQMVQPEAQTAKAENGEVSVEIFGKGTLSPLNQYEVRSLVKGEILKAPFEEGEVVKKNDLLYQISTKEVESEIETAQLALQRAKQAYQQVATQRTDLEVKAGADGWIKKIYVKEGDSVQPDTVIADVYKGNKMLIDVYFPSASVRASMMGKPARVTMEASGEEISGKITDIQNLEQVVSGGILAKKVTITVNNPGGIESGAFATASIGGVESVAAGAFRAELETTVRSGVAGKVEKLSLQEGHAIKAGDTVAILSSKDIESQLENQKLSVKESQIALKKQQEQLENYQIKAPITGKMITKNKKAGDTIDPSAEGGSSLATIYDMSMLIFQMDVDELDIGKVQVGQKVEVSSQAYPNQVFEGVVERVQLKANTSTTANTNNGVTTTNNGVTTYPVHIKIKDFGGLLPGMNVTGKIKVEQVQDVLVIPSTALQGEGLVYVKDSTAAKTEQTDASGLPDGFKAVQVETGLNDGKNVEIKSGLKQGDEVYIPLVIPDSGVIMKVGM